MHFGQHLVSMSPTISVVSFGQWHIALMSSHHSSWTTISLEFHQRYLPGGGTVTYATGLEYWLYYSFTDFLLTTLRTTYDHLIDYVHTHSFLFHLLFSWYYLLPLFTDTADLHYTPHNYVWLRYLLTTFNS